MCTETGIKTSKSLRQAPVPVNKLSEFSFSHKIISSRKITLMMLSSLSERCKAEIKVTFLSPAKFIYYLKVQQSVRSTAKHVELIFKSIS